MESTMTLRIGIVMIVMREYLMNSPSVLLFCVFMV